MHLCDNPGLMDEGLNAAAVRVFGQGAGMFTHESDFIKPENNGNIASKLAVAIRNRLAN